MNHHVYTEATIAKCRKDGWGTTFLEVENKIGTAALKALSAEVKAAGFSGIAMLDEIERRSGGSRVI